AVVNLSKTGSGAAIPATVTVPAGQTTATFALTTSLVSSDQSVSVTAGFNSTTKNASLSVKAIVLSSLTLSPTSVLGASANSTAPVTLNTAAPSGGVSTALNSSNTSAATVPDSVSINAGQTTATFTVTTALVSNEQDVTITASFNSGSQTAVLAVMPI